MRVIPWLLTLIGALWAGGSGVLLMSATALFSWAPPRGELLTRAAAGAAFGTMLERWSAVTTLLMLLTMCALGWCGIVAWRRELRGRAIAFAAAVTLIVVIHSTAQQMVTLVNHMGTDLRNQHATPDADPKRLAKMEENFAKFHSAAETWFALETLFALGLLVGGSVAVLRQARPQTRPTTTAI